MGTRPMCQFMEQGAIVGMRITQVAAVAVLVYCLFRGNAKRSSVISAVRAETDVSRGTFLTSLCKVISNLQLLAINTIRWQHKPQS